ncbi:hypothetical protein J2795_003048 [Chryseobacterium bernardetii]|jgi:hypothetical protein|uniref:Uncharacterized protein n=3 Tax=Chryseobacterium TaxID=59732 RepID=A0A543EL23_9FLAO|nr:MULTISPECIES: hypothetical protein [Chryseobacterium]MDR6372293.1 hypothetical protein [Chryseobacterium vietnamense]MDR6442323.1 hypothetical protein [Chryseobacterium bernardetii]MDR6458692.1 hypothetical protein [Chryseobacterium vietnamense]TQM22270.1 hypothetical protein FB551_1980 [Chryseobacterium aquifrigidense]
MMNIQLILFTIILATSATSCMHKNNNENNTSNIPSAVQQQKIEQIRLTERTRGFSRNIVFTPSSKESNINEEITNTKISSAEWTAISKLAQNIDLPKISELKAPTTGRHSDQAMIASIIITAGGKEYTSSDFDSGRPPKELEALYKAINGPGTTKTP